MEFVGPKVREPGQVCWADPVRVQWTRKSVPLHKLSPVASYFAPHRVYSLQRYSFWFVTRLRYRLIDSDFGLSLCVTGHRQEVAVELRYKERSLRAKATRGLPQRRVMVRIVLFEDLHKLITRKLNVLQLCIVRDVVHHPDAGLAGCHLTGVRIDHNSGTQPFAGRLQNHRFGR